MWILKKSFQFLQILHKYYDFICHKICSLTLTVTTKTGYYGSHEEWEYLSSETEEIFVKRKKSFLCVRIIKTKFLEKCDANVMVLVI